MLTLGFSSCPNDTFIFDAIVNQRIDSEGLEFQFHIADVEELNKLALDGNIDITKISFATYLKVAKEYFLLKSGAAMGENCGPLLVANTPFSQADIDHSLIAIPGENTTANLLLSLMFPRATNKKAMLFSEIEEAVLTGAADLGLIIHESRFTYEQKGLFKVLDLGEFWEQQTATLVPLGGIIMRRSLPREIKEKMNRVLSRSVRYAFDHPEASREFVKHHAQETDDAVIQQHIRLYVNRFSLDPGEKGEAAVRKLFELCGVKTEPYGDDILIN